MSPKSVFFFVLVLLTISTVTLVSISSIRDEGPIIDPFSSFVNVSIRLSVGLLVFLIFSNVDYRKHDDERMVRAYYVITLALLIVVLLIPGEGAKRWIRIGNFSFQPSEIAKIVAVVLLSHYLKRIGNGVKYLVKGVLIPIGLVLPLISLILLEPDMSTALIISLMTVMLVYAAGARFLHISIVLAIVVIIGVVAISQNMVQGYQLERLRSFLEGRLSHQTLLALESIRSGGLTGKGVIQGDVKLLLPAVESDFILAVIGEELGYIGIAVVLVAYTGLVYSLIVVAERFMTDTFAKLFTFGYSYMIVLQVAVNLGVNVGLLPVTGIPLPFVSHGGSSLMAFMAGLGIVTNAVYGRREEV